MAIHYLDDSTQPCNAWADTAGMPVAAVAVPHAARTAITSPVAAVERDTVDGAISRHVTVTTAILTRVLAATVDTFDEPRTPNPEIAMHRLGYLVETLLGAAAGAVIGRVASAMLRGFGREVVPTLEQRLRAALLRIGPGRRNRATGAVTAVRAEVLGEALAAFGDSSTARPLADELGVRVHRRLAHASRDHRDVLTHIATAVPAERTAAFTSAVASLDDDPMLAHLWSEHLVIAWRCYTAAISSTRDAAPAIPPALAATASCETWLAWLRRVRGERPEARPVAPPSGDYIMAVMG